MPADHERPPTDWRRLALGVVILDPLVLVLAELGWRRHSLIDPIPAALLLGSIFAGAVLGICMSVLVARSPSPAGNDLQMGVAIFFLPFLFAASTAYQTYLCVEFAHFYGHSVTQHEDFARVTHTRRGRYGDRFAYVQLTPSLLGTQVRIDTVLYARLDPVRAPGLNCLRVQVETGRNGIRRMVLPNFFDHPFGLDRLVHCDGS